MHQATKKIAAKSKRRLHVPLAAYAVVVFSVATVGCRNPYSYPPTGYPPAGYPANAAAAGGAPAAGPQSVFAQGQTSPQLIELQRRVQQLDENNRQLTTQLAQAQQQAQASKERSDLLAKQMKDLSEQNRQLLAASKQYANQARGLAASINSRGGARLTANNSVATSANGLEISGARVVSDGDLIRIRIPSDQLFSPGSAQLSQNSLGTLDQVATALTRRYSRQRVAIEGHTDAAASGAGYSSPFQLSGAQAQAVMDQLIRRGGAPTQQLFVVAHGANHPLADNQSPAGRAENRRIEIVIYPETF